MGHRCGCSPLILVATVLVLAGLGSSMTLEEVIVAKEKIVTDLADRAQLLYQSKGQGVSECECSIHNCSQGVEESAVCYEKLGPADGCCDDGQMLDYTQSHVITPPNAALDDPIIKEDTCVYKPLDTYFAGLTDASAGVSGTDKWSYLGTTNGLFRLWPGQVRRPGPDFERVDSLAQCAPYDPRLRPWYIAASTGPKDVVLVIDKSNSMVRAGGASTRWQLTVKALTTLLSTFTAADRINIVWFNHDASEVVLEGQPEEPLYSATRQVIASLQEVVEGEFAFGNTDFGKGFNLAFDLLLRATREREGVGSTGCTKTIMFMTDGEDCSSHYYQPEPGQECSSTLDPSGFANDKQRSDRSNMIELIEKRQVELAAASRGTRASVFTISMGQDTDDGMVRQIACANNGAWTYIKDGDDPLSAMGSFFGYLAAGRQSSGVTWTNLYEDDFGLGLMSTAATTVYAPDVGGQPGAMIGVVGTDVLLSDLEAPGEPFAEVLRELIARSSECDPPLSGSCALQVLRGDENECVDNVRDEYVSGSCFSSTAAGKDGYVGPDTPFSRKYYKTLELFRAQDNAKVLCQEMGGQLVTINGRNEAQVVASLSSRDGSWIGLKNGAWQGNRAPPEETSYPLMWAGSGDTTEVAGRGPDRCATIDNRGGVRNVEHVLCEGQERWAICEFLQAAAVEACGGAGAIINLDNREAFDKPIQECLSVAGEADVRLADPRAATADAICPLVFDGASREDVVCCDVCESEGLGAAALGGIISGAAVVLLCIVLGTLYLCGVFAKCGGKGGRGDAAAPAAVAEVTADPPEPVKERVGLPPSGTSGLPPPPHASSLPYACCPPVTSQGSVTDLVLNRPAGGPEHPAAP